VIAVALLSIAVVIYYYQNIKVHDADIQVSSVVVANEDIPVNTLITEDMITVDSRYTTDLLKKNDHITGDESQILGKRTRAPIYKGEEVSTMRLIENKEYMDEKDSEKRTMITMSIPGVDKALNIKRGSFVDIWTIPNQNWVVESGELGMLEDSPTLLFEKLKVYDLKSEIFTPADNSSEESVMTYLTFYLTDAEIETYFGVKNWRYDKRITLHGEHVEYDIINETLEEEPENVEAEVEGTVETGTGDPMEEMDNLINE
jgi:hypothetical protein